MSINLMMVDDSEVDTLLVENALLTDCEPVDFQSFSDPEDFLAHITSVPLSNTSLVLLDINMPKINGFEVLEKIRSSPAWNLVPVIIFSTSSNEQDAQKALQLGANAYLTKPLKIDDYQQMIRSMLAFWKFHRQ
ncbi:response regulator [Cyclobacterium xiamenense]|uniref:response regulator n=1 Tax=Cyclobacterium xiamenense TaxID=1297121 RepID=UPI0012B9A729|nr:response regulator [Cyclobacterium xiamenense]